MIDCEFMSWVRNEEIAEVTMQKLEILKRHTTPIGQKVTGHANLPKEKGSILI